MKCKCEVEIPAARIALGYHTCISCSQEQPRSCIDIITHKTGNTIEICSATQRAAVEKATRRSGYGACAGMRAGRDRKMEVRIIQRAMPARARRATAAELDVIGREALVRLEIEGYNSMCKYLERQVMAMALSASQSRMISEVCSVLVSGS
jgi:hypothetical protein